MDTHKHFHQMFSYDHWANGECLTALQVSAPPSPKVLRLLAHTLSAQKVWLERLQSRPQSAAVWPASTVEECFALADEMLAEWKKYFASLASPDFEGTIDYRNSKGESWSSRVQDILTHVLMHSAYHRGQAALEMRAAGFQPAYTDFIHGVRQGFLE